MTTASRENILKKIKAALSHQEKEQSLLNRVQQNPRGILPSRAAHLSHEQIVSLFIDQAQNALVQIKKLNSIADIPQEIIKIIKQNNFPMSLRIADEKIIKNISWAEFPDLLVQSGAATYEDKISLTTCLCGVAETGTLVMSSSVDSPTTLNFLPEIHVVLLNEKSIVPFYEDAWDLIREQKNNSRTINFITGPSRTGDIEQTVQVGIHGPKQLYVLIY